MICEPLLKDDVTGDDVRRGSLMSQKSFEILFSSRSFREEKQFTKVTTTKTIMIRTPQKFSDTLTVINMTVLKHLFHYFRIN